MLIDAGQYGYNVACTAFLGMTAARKGTIYQGSLTAPFGFLSLKPPIKTNGKAVMTPLALDGFFESHEANATTNPAMANLRTINMHILLVLNFKF